MSSFTLSFTLNSHSNKSGLANITLLHIYRCQSMGRKQIETGTTSSDAKCEYTPNGLVIGIVIGVVVIIVIVVIGVIVTKFVIFKHKSKARPGIR